MKTAVYIQDGEAQIVLTPENDWEKRVIDALSGEGIRCVRRGSFYRCNGGWMRQGTDDESLILSLGERA